MSVTVSTDPVAGRDVEPAGPRHTRPVLAPLLMLVAVAVGAALPLPRNHIFYFWDDSAGAAVPVWHRIAQSVLHGHLPLLNLDMWRGGNFAAEAATGMWNPVMVAVAVAIYPIDNLAAGIALGKAVFVLLMAGGTYLLARDHGMRPPMAAAIGTALPLTGYSFFMDGTAWVNALTLTAFTPWLWWAARLVARGRSPLWLVLVGYLVVSIGNPYGLLVCAFVILAVLVEARRRVFVLLLSGVSVALLNVMVYLPLLLTSSVGFRAASQTLNDNFLKPNLTNLLEASTPSTQPFLTNFGTNTGHPNLAVPVVYLAWFVLPTLPWLRWRLLRTHWREHVGLYVFLGAFGLLMLGPSQIWMFRWPLRLIDFVWIPVLLLWGLLADQGPLTDRWRLRAALSAVAVVVGGYLAWGERPGTWRWEVIGGLTVLSLVALLVRTGLSTQVGAVVLVLGSLLVLGIQLAWFPGNYTVLNYQFPTSVSTSQARFAKYQGTTVQLANITLDVPDRVPDREYRDELFGSMYSVAGVESTTAYSGIGFTALDATLCQAYQGSVTCSRAWHRLWQDPAGYPVPLADLLRASTVVVQNSLVDTRHVVAPPGWHQVPADDASGLVTVWARDTPLSAGRLSHASAGVRVNGDAMVGQVGEQVAYQSSGAAGELTFARLAWPGYTATVDGQQATVRTGPSGLLVVELPAGVRAGQVALSWSPPGSPVSFVALLLGALLAFGLALLEVVRRG
ncbi:MAG TPA: hypothetical protein VFX16_25905 [Pseudonocardiaceae bacterium]|nr:hypothetical protein [Pseudonocardiaceae bacterium]